MLALLFILPGITGCMLAQPETAMEQTAAPGSQIVQPDGKVLYSAACEQLYAQRSQTLAVSISRQLLLGEETVTEEIRQTLTYWDYGTGQMCAYAEQELQLGDYSVSATAYYADGCGYYTVENGAFSGAMQPDAFLADYVPPILLDPMLYGDVSVVLENNTAAVSFGTPTSAENWLGIAASDFVDASGTVLLDAEGRLRESSYTVSYIYCGYPVHQTVTATVLPDTLAAEPVITDKYIAISDPRIPLMLERACGYLTQIKSISATMEETVACDAYGEERHQSTTLQMAGDSKAFTAEIAVEVSMVNHNRAGQQTDSSYLMQYRDGKYSTYLDGVWVQEQIAPVSEARAFCTEQLLATVILPEYIASAEIIDRGSDYMLSFTACDVFAKQLWLRNLQFLYSDQELLKNYASFAPLNTANAYLVIDKLTGLPTASGIFGESVFEVQGFEYRLNSRAEQEYRITKG